MSEFQYVGFRAVDAPLTNEGLQYAGRRSSRARITRRSFDNTYRFGGFRGDAVEMLRRGFDIHLHYANFGIRTLTIRLPLGLPVPEPADYEYVNGKSVTWEPDSSGPAGILTIRPTMEPGEFTELGDPMDTRNVSWRFARRGFRPRDHRIRAAPGSGASHPGDRPSRLPGGSGRAAGATARHVVTRA